MVTEDSTVTPVGVDVAEDSVSEEKPFRFLDIPPELQLEVYEMLICPERHEIKLINGDHFVKVTFIIPCSIPPIHLSCKKLHAEATPFIREKVTKMGPSRTAPRMIVESSCDMMLAGVISLILWEVSITQHQHIRDHERTIWAHLWLHCGGMRMQLLEDHASILEAFCRGARLHLQTTNGLFQSWWSEAFDQLFPQTPQQGLGMGHLRRIQILRDTLAKAPGAANTGLQILIVGENRVGFDMSRFLYRMQACCHLASVRVYGYTLNASPPMEIDEYSDDWFRYAGDLDGKVLGKEWM